MKLATLTAFIALTNAQADPSIELLDFGQYCEDNKECKVDFCCA